MEGASGLPLTKTFKLKFNTVAAVTVEIPGPPADAATDGSTAGVEEAVAEPASGAVDVEQAEAEAARPLCRLLLESPKRERGAGPEEYNKLVSA
jgi:hypothetical protein